MVAVSLKKKKKKIEIKEEEKKKKIKKRSEEKKDILDFFFDGDIIITGAQGYTNISKVLETDYGKVGKDKIITTVGNVISGSARSKDTLDWLSGDIFGKVVQLKKGITIDRGRTSINLNENMDSLVPASKISDMASGWICGQTARDFTVTKTGKNGAMNIQEAEEFKTSKFFCKTNFDMQEIKVEEEGYKNYPLPVYYNFKSTDAKERILYNNFNRIDQEAKDMIKKIQTEFGKPETPKAKPQ